MNSMTNFDQDFASQSLLGHPANSTEQLLSQKKVLLDSMANSDQDFACFSCGTVKNVYSVSIYILLSQKPYANYQ